MRHELQAVHPSVAKKVKFYIGNVRNPQSVHDAMPGVDFIFHAAVLKYRFARNFLPKYQKNCRLLSPQIKKKEQIKRRFICTLPAPFSAVS